MAATRAPRRIDRAGGAPPYAQVRDQLRQCIARGELDGQLPSERAIADTYGVSYMTARRAVGALVDEGMLAREQGRGTFVRSRSPRPAASGKIGIVLPAKIRGGAGNPFFAQVIQGVAEEGRRLGYRQTVIAERAADLLTARGSGEVAGMVAIAQSLEDLPDIDAAREHLPIVGIDCARGDQRIPNIVSDNRGGTRQTAGHLLQLGHRRIAYIGGNLPGEVSEARRSGFLDALAAAGVAADPLLEIAGDFELESGWLAAGRLLTRQPRPTALVCANDAMALGACRRCHELGLRVPQDVSITGFDDVPAAAMVIPGLTTVAVPRLELGWLASQTLAQLIDGGTAEAHRVLPAGLVVRRSTAPPAA